MKIIMAQEAWEFSHALVQEANTEVAVMGYCSPQCNKEYGEHIYVSEVFVIPQEVTSGGVDFVEDGLPFAIEKAVAEDRLHELRFCLHSHCNFGAFFSQTDVEMVSDIGDTGVPYFVSVVLNKKGETYAQVDVYDLAKCHGLPDADRIALAAEVQCETVAKPFVEEARSAIKEFCKRPTFTSTKPKPNGKSHLPDDWFSQKHPDGSYKYSGTGEYRKPGEIAARVELPAGPRSTHVTASGHEVIDATTQEDVDRLLDLFLSNDGWEDTDGHNGTTYFWDADGEYRGSAPTDGLWSGVSVFDSDAAHEIAEAAAEAQKEIEEAMANGK